MAITELGTHDIVLRSLSHSSVLWPLHTKAYFKMLLLIRHTAEMVVLPDSINTLGTHLERCAADSD